jgi:hypothetical protein
VLEGTWFSCCRERVRTKSCHKDDARLAPSQVGVIRLGTPDHDSMRAISRDALTFVTLPVRRLGSVATTTGVTLP